MEAQVQELIKKLNGREPTRADVFELLELIKEEEDPMQWVIMFADSCVKPEKLIDDIKSYPNYNA